MKIFINMISSTEVKSVCLLGKLAILKRKVPVLTGCPYKAGSIFKKMFFSFPRDIVEIGAKRRVEGKKALSPPVLTAFFTSSSLLSKRLQSRKSSTKCSFPEPAG